MAAAHLCAKDFRSHWPFNVDEVIVRCEGGAVTVLANGCTYALNDVARARAAECGWSPIDVLWAQREDMNVQIGAATMSMPIPTAAITAMLLTGQKLCDEPPPKTPRRSIRR